MQPATTNRSHKPPIAPKPKTLKPLQDYTPIPKPNDLPTRSRSNPSKLTKEPTSRSGNLSIPAQYKQLQPRLTPLHTGTDLADAIVASTLASQPKPKPPVPTPRRQAKAKKPHIRPTLRPTLRPTSPSSSSSPSPQRKPHIRRHPHKHHEGDRKRWRDSVTERERRRYEGVWAANKGLFCILSPHEPPSSQSLLAEQVCNLVVRDIWTRSRLSRGILEQVWGLVDRKRVGRLDREEFVVGMWLIDQRLRGRKLPVSVGESVWVSVRGVFGVKVRRG
ncbi:hypothetical protein K470DRAFT_255265 [Piedraia hortae CBS 480.64]|uniref:EH domain-containing protein n=1 Tax=Piedraia hortae CBS 480.64 TaxID=1314780 RepID=A0A6A7C7U5_9PEZI|nr:hypothetical protein K470DRAFT_255265 [Piedraia hortae CBS 480.64]